jgi:heme-degrading monooxygenase HmoA
MAADFWTIHVWTAAPGRETEMADAWQRMAEARLAAMGGGAATLFRVSDDTRAHYTPMHWSSRTAYDEWRAGAGRDGMDAIEAVCSEVTVVPLDVAREVKR